MGAPEVERPMGSESTGRPARLATIVKPASDALVGIEVRYSGASSRRGRLESSGSRTTSPGSPPRTRFACVDARERSRSRSPYSLSATPAPAWRAAHVEGSYSTKLVDVRTRC
jgi:hypothetical protein